MTPVQRILATLAVALSTLLLLPTAATAASSDVVRDLTIEIDIRPDGVLEVTETYDWDFGAREGLGLTRELAARFDYDDDRVRVYEYDDFAVTSPTGAPAGAWPRTRGAEVVVDIGAPDGSDDRRSGRQTYVLSYTVAGALNAIRGQEGLADRDELYWNATGHDWDVPIERASVTVRGPADVVDHACYEGSYGATDRCAGESVDGAAVSVTSARLEPGAGVTVMAAYPPGTFGEIAPILRNRPASEPGSGFGFGQEPAAVTAVGDFVRGHAFWLAPVGVALPVIYGVRRRRRGRDEHYPDLPPGVLPHAGSEPRVEQLTTEPTVAVRFTPPEGLRPGEVGALDTKATTTTHVTATIIDLAVRGFLRLEEAGTNWRGRVNDWTLVATPHDAPADQLRDYERTLLERIFRGRHQVRLSQLRNTFAGTTRLVRRQLGSGLHTAGLVTRPLPGGGSVNPLAFLLPLVFGSVFLFVGFTVVSVIIGRSTGLLALAAVLLIIAFAVTRALTRRARYPRTASGRALHEQSRGFELYLSTAEANQLRFEEGEDIFSRYLPYAIGYGVAERWAAIFAQLEAQGVPVQRPTWYVSPHGFHAGNFQSLGSSLSSFSATAGTTLTSTPGSSGSSGSRGGGGGGGFSGGGGGGGGGGGR